MEKTLILGINGFIGRHFMDYIQRNKLCDKYIFVGVDKKRTDDSNQHKIKFIKADIANFAALEKILLSERPDYVINLVGILSANNLNELLGVNVGISKNIFEVILQSHLSVKRILLIGSAAEYGNAMELPIKEDSILAPINEYGLSKAEQTKCATDYIRKGLNVNIARTFNIVGKNIPTTFSIGNFLDQIKKLDNYGVMHVGNIDTKRDFLDIEDVIDAYWKIITLGKPKEVYNVCSGASVSMKDILNYLINKTGKKITVEVNKNLVRSNDILDSYGDNTKLKVDTGWCNRKDIFRSLDDLL